MERVSPPDQDVDSPGRGSWSRGRGRLVVAGVLLLAAFLYFAFVAFQGSAVYYLTVEELVAQGRAPYGEQVRVNGKLVVGSFQRQEEGTVAHFAMADSAQGPVLQATYDGVVPDLFFNEHSEIVAEGKYNADGVFYADNIIVKCPSKYASQVTEGEGGGAIKIQS